MPIIVNVDVMLARRKMRLNTLADLVGITPQNLSVLKTRPCPRDSLQHLGAAVRSARLPTRRSPLLRKNPRRICENGQRLNPVKPPGIRFIRYTNDNEQDNTF